MSESESEASAKALDGPRDASVLDILYCDARRIGAFLSQFDELGVPTRVSVSESVQKARARTVKFGGSIGIPAVIKGDSNVERTASDSGQKAESRDYDPLWANAFALLDYLESNELISRNLSDARIGQFVLVSGSMAILDLTLFKGVWSLQALRDLLVKNQKAQQTKQGTGGDNSQPLSRQQRRAEQRHGSNPAKSEEESAAEAALAVVGMIPHTVQVHISPSSGPPVWTSLRDDAMVGSASDLVLKHGMAVAGEWSVMGVLDAQPDADSNGDLTQEGKDGVMRSLIAAAGSPFGQLMMQLLPQLRPMLGRPYMSFGMTPLLIYRKIAG